MVRLSGSTPGLLLALGTAGTEPMNDEQYRMAELESSAADTRRRTLALEVLVDRLIGEVDQLRLAMGIIDLG